MKIFLCITLVFLSVRGHGQDHVGKGELALKWDPSRLVNPFNSTIQLGAEYGLGNNWSIHSDVGIRSGLYDVKFYNKGIFISHNQVRKYQRHGNFWGADLFFVHAKEYSDFRCLYNKNNRFSADYDSVTLIKNAPGLALIAGNQFFLGRVVVDFYIGAGARLVINKTSARTITIHSGDCPQTHYNWSNDRYAGTFPGGHFSFGIKLGYLVLKGKR